LSPPGTGEFLAVFVISAIAGTFVFFHAERNRIKHPSAWASAVFLFVGLGLLLYALYVRRVKRARDAS
jgi:cytosine/uracil/thiamine/allantoin permease